MTEQELKDMELHKHEVVGSGDGMDVEILRVYSGWIYLSRNHANGDISQCFVPEYSNVNADIMVMK